MSLLETQNVYNLIGRLNTGRTDPVYDSSLSLESENAVQNKILTAAINEKADKTDVPSLEEYIHYGQNSISSIEQNKKEIRFLTGDKRLSISSGKTETDPSNKTYGFLITSNGCGNVSLGAQNGTIYLAATSLGDCENISGTQIANDKNTFVIDHRAKMSYPRTIDSYTSSLVTDKESLVTNKRYVDYAISQAAVKDTELSDTSTNAVENKAIKGYIDEHGGAVQYNETVFPIVFDSNNYIYDSHDYSMYALQGGVVQTNSTAKTISLNNTYALDAYVIDNDNIEKYRINTHNYKYTINNKQIDDVLFDLEPENLILTFTTGRENISFKDLMTKTKENCGQGCNFVYNLNCTYAQDSLNHNYSVVNIGWTVAAQTLDEYTALNSYFLPIINQASKYNIIQKIIPEIRKNTTSSFIAE